VTHQLGRPVYGGRSPETSPALSRSTWPNSQFSSHSAFAFLERGTVVKEHHRGQRTGSHSQVEAEQQAHQQTRPSLARKTTDPDTPLETQHNNNSNRTSSCKRSRRRCTLTWRSRCSTHSGSRRFRRSTNRWHSSPRRRSLSSKARWPVYTPQEILSSRHRGLD
jgi:hypothetical protein